MNEEEEELQGVHGDTGVSDGMDGMGWGQVETVVDETTELLRRIESADGALSAATSDEAKNLKRRNLVETRTRKSYKLTKGPNFSLQRKKQAAGLNKEMLEGCVLRGWSEYTSHWC